MSRKSTGMVGVGTSSPRSQRGAQSLTLPRGNSAPRRGDSDDDFDFLDDTFSPTTDHGNKTAQKAVRIPSAGGTGSGALTRGRKRPAESNKDIPDFQVSLPESGGGGGGKAKLSQRPQTLPRGRGSVWDKESSGSDDDTFSKQNNDESSDTVDGASPTANREWRRRPMRSPVRNAPAGSPLANRRNRDSLSPQPRRRVMSANNLSMPNLQSTQERGVRGLREVPSHCGETSDPEVDKSSFTASSTESVLMHAPLQDLIQDLPHMHKQQVCALYREALTTIMSLLGASAQPEFNVRSLVHYADMVFAIPPAVSKAWIRDVNAVACKSSILVVELIEAKELAAMDANGFSDPYVCMSIEQPQCAKKDAQDIMKAVAGDQGDATYGFSMPNCSSLQSEMAISSVMKMTLNPKWNETHELKVTDPSTDVLQLFLLDRDDSQDSASIRFSLKGIKEGLRHALKSGGDDFLGRVTIPLQNVPYNGCSFWWPLRQEHTELPASGEIRLRFTYKLVAPPSPPLDMSNTDILQHLRLTMMLQEQELNKDDKRKSSVLEDRVPILDYDSPSDDGHHQRTSSVASCKHLKCQTLSSKAEFILGQFATQRCMSKASIAYATWRVHLDLFMDERLAYASMMDPLQKLNISVGKLGALSDKEEASLAESLQMFVAQTLQVMKEVDTTFPLVVGKGADNMLLMVSSLRMIYAMTVWMKYFPDHRQPREDIQKSLEVRVGSLYSAASKDAKMEVETLDDLCTCIEKMRGVVDLLLESFRRIHEQYGNIFAKVHLDYHTFLLKQTDKLYCEDIKQVVNTAMKLLAKSTGKSQDDVFKVAMHLYHLFICVRQFSIKISSVPLSHGEVLQATSCHQWFMAVLPMWLDCWESKTMEQVIKAVQIDKMEKTNTAEVLFSSSPVDVLMIFSRLRNEMKELLDWPDPITNFTIVIKVTDMLCRFSLKYSTIVHDALVQRLSASEKNVIIDSKVCIPLSNIEHMRSEGINKIAKNLRFEHVTMQVYADLQATTLTGSNLDDIAQAYSGTLTRLVGRASEQMESCSAPTFNQLCKQIGQKVRRILRDFPDRKPIEAVLNISYDILETNIRVMREGVQLKAYKRFILRLWQMLVRIVTDMVTEKTQRHISYYSSMQEAMTVASAKQGFFWFFLTQSGAEIRAKQLETPDLSRLRTALQRQTTETVSLILEYYHQQYLEYSDQMAPDQNLGSLTLQYALLECPTVKAAVCRTLRVNLLHYKDMANPTKDDNLTIFLTGAICPQPSASITTATFKSMTSQGVSAFMDETLDLTIPADMLRKRGLALRICAYKKVSITTADILLGAALLPLHNVAECSQADLTRITTETREFSLRIDVTGRQAVQDLMPVLEHRSAADQDAKRMLAEEKALVAAIAKLNAKKATAKE